MRSGTKKRYSYNLQNGDLAWWSEFNLSVFSTVDILIEARSEPAEEMLEN